MKWILIIILLLGLASAAFAPVLKNHPALRPQKNWYGLEKELPIIRAAAKRNGFDAEHPFFLILCAIRKTEDGPSGFEFGVRIAKGTTLETQADYAARTIIKNWMRWNDSSLAKLHSGIKIKASTNVFIDYLADKYCPPKSDPQGNVNWKKNVKFWFKKFDCKP